LEGKLFAVVLAVVVPRSQKRDLGHPFSWWCGRTADSPEGNDRKKGKGIGKGKGKGKGRGKSKGNGKGKGKGN